MFVISSSDGPKHPVRVMVATRAADGTAKFMNRIGGGSGWLWMGGVR